MTKHKIVSVMFVLMLVVLSNANFVFDAKATETKSSCEPTEFVHPGTPKSYSVDTPERYLLYADVVIRDNNSDSDTPEDSRTEVITATYSTEVFTVTVNGDEMETIHFAGVIVEAGHHEVKVFANDSVYVCAYFHGYNIIPTTPTTLPTPTLQFISTSVVTPTATLMPPPPADTSTATPTPIATIITVTIVTATPTETSTVVVVGELPNNIGDGTPEPTSMPMPTAAPTPWRTFINFIMGK